LITKIGLGNPGLNKGPYLNMSHDITVSHIPKPQCDRGWGCI